MTKSRKNPVPSGAKPKSLEELERWLVRQVELADAGDTTALSRLLHLMKKCPSEVSMFGGNLAKVAASSLIDAITGKRLTWKEAILQKLEQMRIDLAGPEPSPIEELLVDRVVTCWLQVQHSDYLVAESDAVSVQVGDYLRRQQDRAHRRFLSAVKTLATVRRLALPIHVDLNISATVETKPAEPAHSSASEWPRLLSAS